MSLARGIDALHDQLDQTEQNDQTDQTDQTDRTGQHDDPAAVVIAIASTSAQRLRLAALVSDHVPVLLVGSREEALALLRGSPGDDPAVPARTITPPPRPLSPPSVSSLPVRLDAVDGLGRAPTPTGLVVDSDLRVARWEDRCVPLSPLEHDVLVRLVRHVGRTLTFERLHLEVWGSDHLGGGGDVQSVVKRLRRKLLLLSSTLRIHAVRGVGVRLVDVGDPAAD